MPGSTQQPAPDFAVTPANPTQLQRQKAIAAQAQSLANAILENCPESVERQMAFNALRTCIMWAGQAITQPTGQTQSAKG